MAEQFVHDDRFVEAFANRDHVVLGKRLDPFCLWHQFNLEVSQSPVLLGTPMTPLALWAAVKICTTPWTPQHRVPNLRAPGLVRLVWQSWRFNFRKEVAKFQDYFDDHVPGPKLWPNDHKQESEGSAPARDFDENLELAIHLVKDANLTWPEIWTMPVGMLRWISVGTSKLSGAKIDIWTPEHEEMFTAHKIKREAQIDARGKVIATEGGIPFPEARQQAHDEYWAKVKHGYGQQSEQQHRGQ